MDAHLTFSWHVAAAKPRRCSLDIETGSMRGADTPERTASRLCPARAAAQSGEFGNSKELAFGDARFALLDMGQVGVRTPDPESVIQHPSESPFSMYLRSAKVATSVGPIQHCCGTSNGVRSKSA